MPYILYDFPGSGNGHKVRLLLSNLNLPVTIELVDIYAGKSHTSEFLTLNPAGKIPVLVLEDGQALAESNAILFHLAQGTIFWPSDPFEQAQVMQWLFWEQYSHEPFIAVMRSWHHNPEILAQNQDQVPNKAAGGLRALEILEDALEGQEWLVGLRYSIADIALYAYTHVAQEGGFDMTDYPNIKAWCTRIESQSGYIPMVGFREGLDSAH